MAGDGGNSVDPFAKFWADMMGRMGPMAGMGAPQAPQQNQFTDLAQQMQRVFFDAWAKYCDEFMRSEQFLKMMKQSVDGAVQLKKQTDEWLAKTVEGMQMPTRDDVHESVAAIREMEKRIGARLDELTQRVEGLEKGKSQKVEKSK